MGIYGNNIFANQIQEEAMDPTEFMMFCMESVHEVDLMIESFGISSITEASTALTVNGTAWSEEKVKKTITEKAKDLYNKMIIMIKKLINTVKEKVTNFYLNTNMKDALMAKTKTKVSWENLEKAKEKGWIGIPKNVGMVNRLVNFQDSHFFDPSDDLKKLMVPEKEIDEILESESIESAKEKSKKIKEKLKHLRIKAMNLEQAQKYMITNDWDSKDGLFGKGVENAFFAISTIDGGDNNHYYPNKDLFLKTCDVALRGESMVKNMKYENGGYIRSLKEMQNINFRNIISTAKEDKSDRQKLQMIYYKTKFDHYAASIFTFNKIINGVANMFIVQHRMATAVYLMMFKAIVKYVKPEASKLAEDEE